MQKKPVEGYDETQLGHKVQEMDKCHKAGENVDWADDLIQVSHWTRVVMEMNALEDHMYSACKQHLKRYRKTSAF